MNYYCLNENEFGVVCGRKIEGEFNIWFAERKGCVCAECREDWQRIDDAEIHSKPLERKEVVAHMSMVRATLDDLEELIMKGSI